MQHRFTKLIFTLAALLSLICPTMASADNPLIINEIMARNGLAVEDPQGDYDDYVEIFNGSGRVIDVAGMYLTNSLSDPRQWQFPLDQPELTAMPPHSYLVVWADKDETDTGLHA